MKRHRLVGEAGTGLLGTLVGVTIFLVLALLAVQVLFDLYARSALSAAIFDAARNRRRLGRGRQSLGRG